MTARRMEIEPGVFRLASAEHELRPLLRRLDQLRREAAEVEAQIQPLRKRYAEERGEFMLPSLSRLRRELGLQ